MSKGILYFFTKPDPYRPIEEQYVTEINGERKSFIHQDDTMLYLFDNGIKTFRRLTKEIHEYKDITKVPIYEFMHVANSTTMNHMLMKMILLKKEELMYGDLLDLVVAALLRQKMSLETKY